MADSQIIKIIMEAVDRVSGPAKKVQDQLDKIGDSSKNGMDKASQATKQYNDKIKETNKNIVEQIDEIKKMGANGLQSYNKLSASQKKAIAEMTQIQNAETKVSQGFREIGSVGLSSFQSLSGAQQQAILKLGEVYRQTEKTKTETESLGNKIKNQLSNSWDTFKNKVGEASNDVKTKLSGAIETVKGKLNSLNNYMGGMISMISASVGALGMSGIGELTIGLAMTREQMTSLTQATMGSRQEAEKFVGTLDRMTDKSLVSLNDLGQAMNTIKMSTGMSNEQLTKFATVVNDIGQRAILMGKDTNEAMTLMQAAGQGLNGEFDVLKNNFGITKQKLMDLGWSGAASDVEGYQKALEQALEAGGSMDEMLNTTTGQIQLIKKGFTAAGREIGEVFLPVIKQILSFMVDLKAQHPIVFKIAIAIGAVVSALATLLPILVPIIESFQKAYNFLTGLPEKIQNTIKWIQDIPEKIESIKQKLETLQEKLSTVKDKVSEFAGKIREIATDKLDIIKQKLGQIGEKAGNAKQKIIEFAGKIREIATDKLDTIKQKLGDIASKVMDAKGKIIEFAGRLKTLAVDKITMLKDKIVLLAESIDLATIKEKLYAAAQWLVNGATAVWNALLDANPVMLVVLAIAALIAILFYLYNTNEDVRNAIDGLFAILQQVGGWLMSNLVPALQFVWDCLVNLWNILTTGQGAVDGVAGVFEFFRGILEWIGQFIPEEFQPAWDLVLSIFDTVSSAVLQIVDVFMQFMDGQISLPQMLLQIWTIISNMFSNILGQIINNVIQWALNLWNQAVQAGMNFLNGVGQFISQLPGKVWNWIITTAQRIVSGVINWVTNGRKGASDTVTAVMDWIKQLPNKVYQEFINIGKRILDAIGGAVDAAKQFGSQVYNSVMDVLHIHSPGIIQEKIATEFANISGRIRDQVGNVVKAAKEFASAVVDTVSDSNVDMDLTPNVGYDPLVGENVDSVPTQTLTPMTVPISPDTTELQSGLADIGAITQDSNQAIAGSFDLMTQSMNTSLNQMVADNQLAYSSMQSTDATTMMNIRNNMSTSMTLMRNNTNSQLNTMLNNTRTTNNRVTSSWSQMGSSVIRTSEQIKTRSTGYFNQLSNTIGGFYRKLQNPSSWGAGGNYGGGSGRPTRNRKVGHTNTMTGKIRSIFQSRNIDNDTITLRQAKVNPFIDTTSLSYINPNSNPNSPVSLSTLARYGAIKLPTGNFGGWDATNVNYKHIHDTANKWKMKTPNIGPYSTNGKFIVEQFETGVPQIDYNTFRSLAEDVYSQTDYDFYSDSDKYGNWVTAFLSGAFNCSDGADSLVAMAHAFGLSAHKVHGHWNNLGHFWAEVEGHKMDTTGWQQHRTWTPSQSHAGPAPRGFVTNPIEELRNIFTESQNRNGSENNPTNDDPLNVNINLNEKHTVNLENVPNNINQEELETIITDMFNERTNDDSWIEKLVHNPVFQELDIRVKEWRQRAQNRNNGVIH